MARADLSPGQKVLLAGVAQSSLGPAVYLTGGTALSAFHLHHRTSDDIDLFSRDPIDGEAVREVMWRLCDEAPKVGRVGRRLHFLGSVAGEPLKVEFVHYDHDAIEPPQPLFHGLRVDGLRDIFANKLSALVDRTEPKDFADVLFLLKELPLEQAMQDCETKFGWPGLRYLLQQAFSRAQGLSAWPDLDPPITLDQAKERYLELTRGLILLDADDPP